METPTSLTTGYIGLKPSMPSLASNYQVVIGSQQTLFGESTTATFDMRLTTRILNGPGRLFVSRLGFSGVLYGTLRLLMASGPSTLHCNGEIW